MSEVFGLDLKAWELWISYRKQIRKPLKPVSQALAMKRLAALGPQQLEAVEHSISNGYQGLFAPKSAKRIVQKVGIDQKLMEELKVRAQKIGFRQPLETDDLIGYKTLVERAESQQWYRQREGRASA